MLDLDCGCTVSEGYPPPSGRPVELDLALMAALHGEAKTLRSLEFKVPIWSLLDGPVCFHSQIVGGRY
jgi:hypothetical protein